MRARQSRTAALVVRVTPEERDAIHVGAKALDTSASDLMRTLTLAAAYQVKINPFATELPR